MAIGVLMVAEKPSIAETLAKALSRGNVSTRKGVSPFTSVWEFNGTFERQSAWFRVTSTCGHVYATDFTPEFQNWDKVDPMTLYGAPVVKNEANPKARMPEHFRKEARGCHHLVLWLDCDREGENICFEVIKDAQPSLSQPAGIWRAQFSALDAPSLQRAFDNLGYPNKDMSDSVDARQEMDLKFGVSFTRFQTKYFQGKYGDLDARLVSYGPCQTPTLWFCVQRHDAIQAFQPESFYSLDVTVNGRGQDLPLEWERAQVFDLPIATTFKEIVQRDGAPAWVVDVSSKTESRPRPQALNTVAMLKMASSMLGMGPAQAMHVAETLYLRGYLTYPRTETNAYPKTFDLRGAVSSQQSQPIWGNYARELLQAGLNRPREGTDAGDHPPITPVRAATEAELGGEGWRLYELVTRHFLASVSGDCKFLRKRVTFTINEERFSLTGRQMIDPGFTKVQRSGEMQDINVPDFQQGEKVMVKEVRIGNHKTTPPPYLSESDLLGLMEKHGIGTDASMATHINNICERNYVQLIENRRLQPTKLGIALVHGYQIIDNELVVPKVRANIESSCTLIANGRAHIDAVVHHALRIFKAKFEYFVKNIEFMDQLFESTFSSLQASGRPLSRCGNCNKYMNLVDRRPVRMYCRHCDQSYQLPQDGQIKLYQELRCPLDQFELVLVANKVGKTYPLCPMCYNNPPFGGAKTDCWSCMHPTCKHAVSSVGVLSCPEEHCTGTVCLETMSAPKWQMDCNVCSFQLKIFQDQAHKIKVLDEVCEECEARLLNVVFNPKKLPKEMDGKTERTACLVCDEVFNSLVTSSYGKGFRRGKGGKSKGKGKGKGKGKKGKKNVDPRMTFDGF